MAERKDNLPGAAEVQTGQTLPLGGKLTRASDERTTLRLRYGPAVRCSRTVFVDVQEPSPIFPQRQLTSATLSGPARPSAAQPDVAHPALAATLPALSERWAVPALGGDSAPSDPACKTPAADVVAVSEDVKRLAKTLVAGSAPCEPLTHEPQPQAALAVSWDTLKAQIAARSSQAPAVAAYARELSASQPSGTTAARLFQRLSLVFWLGLTGLGFVPVRQQGVTLGTFERYAQMATAEGGLAGRVRAVHVRPGQAVRAGAPLLTLDVQSEEKMLADIEAQLAALAQASVASAALDEVAPEMSEPGREAMEAAGELEARVRARQAQLSQLEQHRDALVAVPSTSPLKLSALDDQVDVVIEELRALAAEQERLAQLLRQPTAQPPEEQLAREVAWLQEQRAQLARRISGAVVRAPQAGVVAQLEVQVGDRVDGGAAVARLLPAGTAPTLIAHFETSDARALVQAASGSLSVGGSEDGASQPLAVRIRRAERRARPGASSRASNEAVAVELVVDDATSIASLVRRLGADTSLSLTVAYERMLFAWAWELVR